MCSIEIRLLDSTLADRSDDLLTGIWVLRVMRRGNSMTSKWIDLKTTTPPCQSSVEVTPNNLLVSQIPYLVALCAWKSSRTSTQSIIQTLFSISVELSVNLMVKKLIWNLVKTKSQAKSPLSRAIQLLLLKRLANTQTMLWNCRIETTRRTCCGTGRSIEECMLTPPALISISLLLRPI